MPNYVHRCGSCGIEQDRPFPIGEAPRIMACDFCGGIQQLVIGAGVQIAPSALEGKGAAVRATNAKDFQLDKDRTAYKRMRDRGLQPDSVAGSAGLENKVEDQMDITYGKRLAGLSSDPWKSVKERVKEGVQISQESGWSPV